MTALKETILIHALKNALDFNGKVNPKFVLGMTLRDNPELKKDVPSLMKEIDEVVKDVEGMDSKAVKAKLQKVAPELLVEKKEKKSEGPLKPLQNAVKGKVITRIAPSPSGPLHIGHAYGASLNYEYAKMYEGKLFLRIEDTNPENIYEQAYEMIEDDINWLTENGVSEVMIQSSRLGVYYDHAEKLVGDGHAYVCTCDSDKWREMKNDGEACPCRELGKKENQLRYARMFNEYAEGEAVLRIKTDIQHKNPAMRDFPAMRIVEHVHPKTGKESRVWPLMVLSVAVDDHLTGVTHVLNGKEHADNAAKEALITEALGWKPPVYQHWGKINFKGFKLKTSTTKIAIQQNEFDGWEDIRLPFLPALRKRGYQPGAFRKFALEIGLSLNDKHVTMEEFWKMVNAFNKEIVEAKANRYFFVEDPFKITVIGAPEKKVELLLHPDFPKRGKREFAVKDTFYISGKDFKKLGEGYLHRLMDCCNFRLQGKTFHYVSDSYEEYKNAPDKGNIIHWLPGKGNVEVEVLLEDGRIVLGIGEEGLRELEESTIVQLERLYFARLDEKKDKIKFYYLHR